LTKSTTVILLHKTSFEFLNYKLKLEQFSCNLRLSLKISAAIVRGLLPYVAYPGAVWGLPCQFPQHEMWHLVSFYLERCEICWPTEVQLRKDAEIETMLLFEDCDTDQENNSYHVRRIDGLWAFGLKQGSDCWYFWVEQHDHNTLIPIIER